MNPSTAPLVRNINSDSENKVIDQTTHSDIEEKRRAYKCGNKYVTLDSIPNLTEYFSKLNSVSRHESGNFTINETLNNKISVWQGDITALEIDAIVNAANNSLLGGGGVDGAIHSAAGPQLKKKCATLNGCETGNAKITPGYKLPAKYVIHTVGPIGENEEKLHSCYQTCLSVLKENSLRSVAFPCISTGIYGYPNKEAARIAIETVRNWLQTDNNADKVDRIIFCLFLPIDVTVYQEFLPVYFPFQSSPSDADTSSSEVNTTKDVAYPPSSGDLKSESTTCKKMKLD